MWRAYARLSRAEGKGKILQWFRFTRSDSTRPLSAPITTTGIEASFLNMLTNLSTRTRRTNFWGNLFHLACWNVTSVMRAV
jgi:hypothetical protein